MFTKLGRWLEDRLMRGSPWTNVVGVARTLLALSLAATLLANRTDTLFRPVYSLGEAPFCDHTLQKAALFCFAGRAHVALACWVAVAVLLVVASGWRPRVTALPHWWIAHSYFATAASVDGGDQAAVVLTLLLLPVALTDPRRWHWDAPPAAEPRLGELLARLAARLALILVALQVAGIYFHAAIGKVFVNEWQDGTALYYWLRHPYFGVDSWLRGLVTPLMENRYTVSALTWGVITLEFFLAMGVLATRPAKRVLLALGVALHLGIMLCHGLASFALVMWAALILFLRPVDEPFAWPSRALAAWRALRTARIARAPATSSAAAAVPAP